MGLRFTHDVILSVLDGVQKMQESTTYQWILREGRTQGLTEGLTEGRIEGQVEGRFLEAQRLLLRLGRKRFSEPDAASLALIEAIHDVDQLETLVDRVYDQDVHNWNDLLGVAHDE
jgi:predicted transposase YdaD